MPKMTFPVEGAGVRQGTNYVRTANGGVAVANGGTESAQPPSGEGAPLNLEGQQAPASPPPRDLTLLEQFHPQLGPDKDISWDEKTGKIRISLRPEPDAEGEDVPDTAELPELGEQHETIIDAVTQTPQQAPPNDTQELKSQVGQLTQLVTLMLQAQAQGKPIAEVLGQPPAPQEPDYSEVDMYDPLQASKMFKDIVRQEIQSSMQQHQPTLQAARVEQEYRAVEARYKNEPNYSSKMVTALQMVADNQEQGRIIPIEQAYLTATKIHQSLSIPATQASTAAANQATTPALTNQPRTLTREQADAKAAQAKRLPANKGVRGAGPSEAPDHVRRAGLGQLMAWHAHQASLGH